MSEIADLVAAPAPAGEAARAGVGAAALLEDVEQYTGLSALGWKGTLAMLPQLEQTASNIWRGPRGALLAS